MMSDAVAAKKIRKWLQKVRDPKIWPTDKCDYEQHLRFVQWRDKYWYEKADLISFPEFVEDYLWHLEHGKVPPPEPIPY